MKLKAIYDTLEDVPESFRELFSKGDDGKYHLSEVEGITTKDKVNQFRENNVTLLKEKEKLKEQLKLLEGVDPEKYKEMEAKLLEIQDKELLDKGKIEELLEQRTARIKKDFENKGIELTKTIETQKAELESLTGMLTQTMIEADVSSAVSAIGKLQKGALFDVKSRAHRDWRLDDVDGKKVLRAYDQNGALRYGSEGQPLTPAEWAKDLAENAPHLFAGSVGSGSQGDGGSHGTGQTISIDSMPDLTADQIAKIASGELKVTG